MAIQILPRQPSFLSQLGRSLGTGLGEGLTNLADQKLQQLLQGQQLQQRTQAFEKADLPGILAQFEGPSQATLLQHELEGRKAPQQQQSAEKFADLSELLLRGEELPANAFVGLSHKEITDISNLSIRKQEAERKEAERRRKYSSEDNKFISKTETVANAAETGQLALDNIEYLIDDPDLNWGLWARTKGVVPFELANSDADVALDSALTAFVQSQFAKELTGTRAGKSVIDLMRDAKITRGTTKKEMKRRIGLYRDAMRIAEKEKELLDDIKLTDMRKISSNFEKIKKILPVLPQAGTEAYPEGKLLRYKDYIFESINDEWIIVGKEDK